jgi:uncharacterized protein (DUF1697 family)
MARLIALLRGVNLASRNRVAMADLRRLMGELGYEDARTLLQSGNVVFTADEEPDAAARRIERAIAAELGLDIGVLVRTRDELARVVERNPLRESATEGKWYMVVFLSAEPDRAALAAIDAAGFEPEVFAADGREIYVWFPAGVQKARLTHAFWEKRLGVTATARNWNTVEKLLALADE